MKIPWKKLGILVALVAALSLLLPSVGSAQIPLPLPTGEPTPTPTPTPTKTSSPRPKPSTSPTKDADGDGRPAKDDARKKSSKTDPAAAKGISAWLGRERTPARTTTRLLELIERTEPGKSEPTLAEKRAGFGQFPVVGYVWYQDDYGAPRYFPFYHPHAGTDLFAKAGTPVMAVADGTVTRTSTGGGGGNAVWLRGDDDVRYYYGHLKSVARGIKAGVRVRQGDLVGTVGATGASAKGTYPHVHFEINPGGRGTINPKPVLDAWLDAAEAAALDRLGLVRARDELAPLGAARWDLLSEVLAEQVVPPPPLWAFALDGSATAYADLMIADLLDGDAVSPPSGADGPAFAPFLEALGSLDGFGHAE